MKEAHEEAPSVLDDGTRAITPEEFCALEGLTPSQYDKLRRKGLGPDGVCFPGMYLRRITPQARVEWHKRIEAYRVSAQSKLEAERRTAFARNAGRKAAESDFHISKIRKAKTAAKAAKAKVRAS